MSALTDRLKTASTALHRMDGVDTQDAVPTLAEWTQPATSTPMIREPRPHSCDGHYRPMLCKAHGYVLHPFCERCGGHADLAQSIGWARPSPGVERGH